MRNKPISPREYYEHLIDTMPPGLDRAILSILRFHIGLDNAVEKEPLMLELSKTGYGPRDERQVRLAIVKLRKAGVPVCSSSKEAGYFLPLTFAEFEEFVAREYWKKVKDMAETARSMTDNVANVFPTDYQRWKSTHTFSINPEMLEISGDIEEAFAIEQPKEMVQPGLF
jgi:hypothetical protein